MSYHEVVASSLFFQFSLYVCARLAHRGFTFGELGLVAFGATVLFMELLNLTTAKVRRDIDNVELTIVGLTIMPMAAITISHNLYQDI